MLKAQQLASCLMYVNDKYIVYTYMCRDYNTFQMEHLLQTGILDYGFVWYYLLELTIIPKLSFQKQNKNTSQIM